MGIGGFTFLQAGQACERWKQARPPVQMHGSAEWPGTGLWQPLRKRGFAHAIRADDDDGESGWTSDPTHNACDRSRGEKAGSCGVAETPAKYLHPREAPNGRVRRGSALDGLGQPQGDVSPEYLDQSADERGVIGLGEGPDVLPLACVGDSLSHTLRRQVRSTNGIELSIVGTEDGLGGDAIKPDGVRIIERVEMNDVAVAVDHPVPGRDVVAEALEQSEGSRQTQRPERIEVAYGTVHVAAASVPVLALAWSVQNAGGRAEERQDLVQ
jgi:hypothetical protein